MTTSADRIAWVRLSSVYLPLATPISDAKVLTGRQRPMTEIAFLFAEIGAESGHQGFGFGYSKRAGGPGQYAHAREIAPELLGEDPNDIARLWEKLVWAGASVGRSGLATQAIAALDIALWDLKAKRAGLPLAKLLGAHRDSVRCYNTSGGFLHTPIEQVLENATASLERGIGGIKLKVGHPDSRVDLARVRAVREHLGDGVPADGRRQPAVGPADRPAHGPGPGAVRPGVDRGAARRLRQRRPRRARRLARHRRSPPARCSPASPSTPS